MFKDSFSIILIKIFVKGFYRKHAGVFCFVLYILFGIVEPGQLLSYHKTLMLSFLSSLLILSFVFIGWLLYIFKSWHYISGEISKTTHLFLFYSSTSFNKRKQLKSWAIVQIWILSPILIYACIAIVYGLSLHLYLIPFLITFYLLCLILSSAYFYHYMISKGIQVNFTLFTNFSFKWRKSFFSLFIYQILEKNKLSYLIIKIASWFALTGTLYFFADVKGGNKLAGVIILSIVMIHSFLIIQEHEFSENTLNFSRNLPFIRFNIFLNSIKLYVLILIPETISLFFKFSFYTAFEVWILAISLILLFRSLLYHTKQDMDTYLKLIFAVFVASFLFIMFNMMWVLIALTLLGSMGIFYNRYYHYERNINRT